MWHRWGFTPHIQQHSCDIPDRFLRLPGVCRWYCTYDTQQCTVTPTFLGKITLALTRYMQDSFADVVLMSAYEVAMQV